MRCETEPLKHVITRDDLLKLNSLEDRIQWLKHIVMPSYGLEKFFNKTWSGNVLETLRLDGITHDSLVRPIFHHQDIWQTLNVFSIRWNMHKSKHVGCGTVNSRHVTKLGRYTSYVYCFFSTTTCRAWNYLCDIPTVPGESFINTGK